ncbi:MAG: HTTM domain-containing protein [Anaerolineae bacterium]|nr:HTTM domain-containing protein [Anaerolineae bacterium]
MATKLTGRLPDLRQPVSILPLVVFRVLFAMLMLASTIRFVANGWVEAFYLKPEFHFTYYGFSWVKPLPGVGLYLVFGLVALAALFIALGFMYRAAIIAFFLLFTYTELLDKTYYLNHYYFISLLSFLLIFLPLHRSGSLDSWLWPALKTGVVPRWTIFAIRVQLGLVYVFAGIAKLNGDWLFQAMPLKLWLAAQTGFPFIGFLFDHTWFAYLMSWSGAIYDLTIPFFLLWRKTRPAAYLTVIGFHLMTAKLFPIGMFPWIMIACTTIFFSEQDYQAAITFIRTIFHRLSVRVDHTLPGRLLPMKLTFASGVEASAGLSPISPTKISTLSLSTATTSASNRPSNSPNNNHHSPQPSRTERLILILLSLFFILQILIPLRHWLYPGSVLWTEEGFRFSWRVMLVEKTGFTLFLVRDPNTGQEWTVYPRDYLTYQQEKQMSFQPDMILEFAHYLERRLAGPNQSDLEIRAEAYVSFNGRSSRLLIDPTVDLSQQQNSLLPKRWILPIE